jgi:hypothetical protein
LVVTRISILEGKPFVARRGVNDLIDAREQEGILWTMFVERSVVDTYTKNVCIFLGDQHWIGNPSRILDLFDESSVLKTMELY